MWLPVHGSLRLPGGCCQDMPRMCPGGDAEVPGGCMRCQEHAEVPRRMPRMPRYPRSMPRCQEEMLRYPGGFQDARRMLRYQEDAKVPRRMLQDARRMLRYQEDAEVPRRMSRCQEDFKVPGGR
ncbi:hypothetical protein DUI87_22597 [Hirundo rustica rustica]|uniref:Uncharacterized protein n=1 Tax=Hirundo rustica rustica TaxID=333673 RepID=A0A3M0JQ79_HIRRU|nr:hypothetical protein DUI87_22597 [Hirundo rustica rustica]